MAIDHITQFGLSVLAGATLAAQEIPGLEVADRVGLGAIAVVLVWWMLGRFSKQIDKLTESVDKLAEHIKGKE